MPKTNVTVQLVGQDGNAMAIMSRVAGTMRRAGVSKETIDNYLEEVMSGDYDDVLRTTMEYVEVE